MKKCPFCAESIQEEAVKCKYCGEWLKAKDITQPAESPSQDLELPPIETPPQNFDSSPNETSPKKSGASTTTLLLKKTRRYLAIGYILQYAGFMGMGLLNHITHGFEELKFLV